MAQERSMVVGLVIAAGALALLSSAPTWVSATVRDEGLPEVALQVNGRSVAPLVAAAGLLALAGGLASLLAGVWARRVIGGMLLVAGGAAVWGVLSLLAGPKSAVEGPLSDAVGLTRVVVATADVSVWPTIAAIACALIAVGGAWMLARASRWTAAGRRFERTPREGSTHEDGDDQEGSPPRGTGLWDALDRGEDPTL